MAQIQTYTEAIVSFLGSLVLHLSLTFWVKATVTIDINLGILMNTLLNIINCVWNPVASLWG